MAAHPVRAAQSGCTTEMYAHASCYVVPSSGTITIQIVKTRARHHPHLTCSGSPSDAGAAIVVVRVSVPGQSRHVVSFKVVTSGHTPPLTLSGGGTLYKYNPATKRWYRVKAVRGSGIYKVAYH